MDEQERVGPVGRLPGETAWEQPVRERSRTLDGEEVLHVTRGQLGMVHRQMLPGDAKGALEQLAHVLQPCGGASIAVERDWYRQTLEHIAGPEIVRGGAIAYAQQRLEEARGADWPATPDDARRMRDEIAERVGLPGRFGLPSAGIVTEVEVRAAIEGLLRHITTPDNPVVASASDRQTDVTYARGILARLSAAPLEEIPVDQSVRDSTGDEAHPEDPGQVPHAIWRSIMWEDAAGRRLRAWAELTGEEQDRWRSVAARLADEDRWRSVAARLADEYRVEEVVEVADERVFVRPAPGLNAHLAAAIRAAGVPMTDTAVTINVTAMLRVIMDALTTYEPARPGVTVRQATLSARLDPRLEIPEAQINTRSAMHAVRLCQNGLHNLGRKLRQNSPDEWAPQAVSTLLDHVGIAARALDEAEVCIEREHGRQELRP